MQVDNCTSHLTLPQPTLVPLFFPDQPRQVLFMASSNWVADDTTHLLHSHSSQFQQDTPDKPSLQDRIVRIHNHRNTVPDLVDFRRRHQDNRRFGVLMQGRKEKI